MTRIHRVRGRVTFHGGTPVIDALVVIADADAVCDDVIALGRTDIGGRFRVSFAPEAFNQELFEQERHPDLYVVVLRKGSGGWVPVHRFDFSPSDAYDRDLGQLELPVRWDAPIRRAGQRILPRTLVKRAVRVRVTEELLADAVSEMAGRVGQLTGWTDLARDLRVELVDDMDRRIVDDTARRFEGGVEDPVRRGILAASQRNRAAGLYNPTEHRIFVHRGWVQAQGVDGLRMLLGHELVHVGQFRNHPQLVDSWLEMGRRHWEAIPLIWAAQDGHGEHLPAVIQQLRDQFPITANIEGYALYIEHGFLRAVDNCAGPMPHLPLWERGWMAMRAIIAASNPSALPKELLRSTGGAAGREAYQKRQAGARPAAFDPDMRIAPPTPARRDGAGRVP